tara:strand:- start:98 stop:640 length:543 start_codon:yes stop_codon:yes gene_type:complete
VKVAHKHQEGKVCTKCNKHQPLSEFFKDKVKKGGLKTNCKDCDKERERNRCPFQKAFINKRSHALNGKYKFEFTIEPEDIPGVKIKVIPFGTKTRWVTTEYPKQCSDCGGQIDWSMNGMQYNSPSFDRIDPNFDYVIRPDGKCNVRLICNSCNASKLNCPPDLWEVERKRKARFILFGSK